MPYIWFIHSAHWGKLNTLQTKKTETNKKIKQTNLLFGQKTNKNWNKVPTTAEDSENKVYTESTF